MVINEFKTKYGIGQELYRIKLDAKNFSLDKKCEHCGHFIYNSEYIVENCEYLIVGVYKEEHKETHYKIWVPCVIAKECISESSLEEEFFLSKQAAQDECTKRNEGSDNAKIHK